MANFASSAAPAITPTHRHLVISSHWLSEGEYRFDASHYAHGAYQALDAIAACRYPKQSVGEVCGTLWHPVQNQARSNFKRNYTTADNGVPFVGSRDMFALPLHPHRFVSKRMRKLHDLMVPEGWLLVSRSGTVGNLLYVGKRLTACAITEHAIRIEPIRIETGYLYAFLASSYGKAILEKGTFGATVDEIEPKHIAEIPIPIAPQSLRKEVHQYIVRAEALRDEVNALVAEADKQLHEHMGVSPFTATDIEYIGGANAPRAFTVLSSELLERLDASNHVPIARSAVDKLVGGNFPLVALSELCSHIAIPPRFKRNYVTQDYGVPYLLPSQLLLQRPYGLKALSERQARESPEYLLKEGQLLVTTDGTIGRVHPVTLRMNGWFGSNNMARLWDSNTDMGFLYAFLTTPFGLHQLRKEIYGGVVDHIEELDITSVLCPNMPVEIQKPIGELVRKAFGHKDQANELEDRALAMIDHIIKES